MATKGTAGAGAHGGASSRGRCGVAPAPTSTRWPPPMRPWVCRTLTSWTAPVRPRTTPAGCGAFPLRGRSPRRGDPGDKPGAGGVGAVVGALVAARPPPISSRSSGREASVTTRITAPAKYHRFSSPSSMTTTSSRRSNQISREKGTRPGVLRLDVTGAANLERRRVEGEPDRHAGDREEHPQQTGRSASSSRDPMTAPGARRHPFAEGLGIVLVQARAQCGHLRAQGTNPRRASWSSRRSRC